MLKRFAIVLVILCSLAALPASADDLWSLIPPQTTNLALTGTASSSGGWGGGSITASINDGLREYGSWANGLAFTFGPDLKWAIIDFHQTTTFNEVVMWQHGVNFTPSTVSLDYWNGTDWTSISVNQRLNDPAELACHAPGNPVENSGYSDCDIFLFDSVQGSKVRYSFYNGQLATSGSPLIHGWIYEFEVYDQPVPEPATLLLVAVGLVPLLWRKR